MSDTRARRIAGDDTLEDGEVAGRDAHAPPRYDADDPRRRRVACSPR